MAISNEESPVRVLVIISNRSPHWGSAWQDPEKIIEIATEAVKASKLCPPKDDPSILFLAKEKWHHRIFIVYDIGNDNYDAATAHKPDQNTITVISVRFGTKTSATFATPAIRLEVNRTIA